MKTNQFLTIAALAAAVLASCTGQETAPADDENSSITAHISVLNGDNDTKAAANTAESTLTDVQVFVFNTADELYRYCTLTAAEMSSGTFVVKGIKAGVYSMYLVANGPAMASSVRGKSDLLSAAIDLGTFNSPSGDFVMSGCSDDIVITAGGTTDVHVVISRYVSRVTLSRIVNNLPSSFGDMTVNYAVLSNVVGNQTIGGDSGPSVWYNRDCRADEDSRQSGHIIGVGSYEASCKDNTFSDYSETVAHGYSVTIPKYFYGYPNSSTVKGDGFSEPFTPKATCLDLSISFTVAGTPHTYYYNVPILGTAENPGIRRNYDYDVQVTVSGEGADEPGKYILHGGISVTVTIEGWQAGPVTEIEI